MKYRCRSQASPVHLQILTHNVALRQALPTFLQFCPVSTIPPLHSSSVFPCQYHSTTAHGSSVSPVSTIPPLHTLLQCSPVSTIPPLHSSAVFPCQYHSTTAHSSSVFPVSTIPPLQHFFSVPLSVPFHHCTVLQCSPVSTIPPLHTLLQCSSDSTIPPLHTALQCSPVSTIPPLHTALQCSLVSTIPPLHTALQCSPVSTIRPLHTALQCSAVSTIPLLHTAVQCSPVSTIPPLHHPHRHRHSAITRRTNGRRSPSKRHGLSQIVGKMQNQKSSPDNVHVIIVREKRRSVVNITFECLSKPAQSELIVLAIDACTYIQHASLICRQNCSSNTALQ